MFCYLPDGFSDSEIKSLEAVAKLVEKNGALIARSLAVVARYINVWQHDEDCQHAR
jgi:hypothetical protein